MNPLVWTAGAIALALLVGFAVGVTAVIVALQLTGRMVGLASPGPLHVEQPAQRVVASPEGMAHQHISESAIEVGAAHLLEVARENGIRMTDKMARKQAEAMLLEGQPLGGVQ